VELLENAAEIAARPARNERVALRRAHDRVGKVAAIRVGKSKIRRAKKPVATAPASANWRTRTDERNRPQSARES
jgi:hypothetical protein